MPVVANQEQGRNSRIKCIITGMNVLIVLASMFIENPVIENHIFLRGISVILCEWNEVALNLEKIFRTRGQYIFQ